MTRDRFLSDAELARFMAAVRERKHRNQPRDYALFALLANTGIRPSEALALERADLHLSGKAPWMRVSRMKKKNSAGRFDELQLPAYTAGVLLDYVEKYAPEAGPVFPIHRRQAERLFHTYARHSGIRERLWLYCLRHTAATRIYAATRDISIVQAILGHEKPDTSCIYAHVTREILQQHAAAMPVVL